MYSAVQWCLSHLLSQPFEQVLAEASARPADQFLAETPCRSRLQLPAGRWLHIVGRMLSVHGAAAAG